MARVSAGLRNKISATAGMADRCQSNTPTPPPGTSRFPWADPDLSGKVSVLSGNAHSANQFDTITHLATIDLHPRHRQTDTQLIG